MRIRDYFGVTVQANCKEAYNYIFFKMFKDTSYITQEEFIDYINIILLHVKRKTINKNGR